ncbi:helix-turn-helix domain-containing protein [Planctomycetota bacterium]|nr:helix-turn-helix domain-containing protein [Planctomycetota bacterium]
MSKTIEDICTTLHDIRREKKVSLNVMADLADIDKSTLSKYERGLKLPKLDTLEKWSNTLGYTVSINLHKALVEVEA